MVNVIYVSRFFIQCTFLCTLFKELSAEVYRINVSEVNYSFQCGDKMCEGIYQFCTDDWTCGNCNIDICKSTNTPGQCIVHCQILQQQSETVEERQVSERSTKNYILQQKDEDSSNCYILVFGSVGGLVTIVLVIGCVLCVRKSQTNVFTNVKICLHKCCSGSDYRDTHVPMLAGPENDHVHCDNRNDKTRTVPSGATISEG